MGGAGNTFGSMAIGALLLVSLCVGGCGRVTGAGPAATDVATIPQSSQTPLPSPLAVGLTGSLPLGGAAAPGVTGGEIGILPLPPACDLRYGCDGPDALQLADVNKKKNGFLWRKLLVTGQAMNRSIGVASGEVIVRFTKKGQVVQTEFLPIAGLTAGRGQAFEVQSKVAADDALISVTKADSASGPKPAPPKN